ncbi:hypothetical protein ACFU98_31090 [Streptomyces sp. NPDC057575]|uniref:hypothetical protein n=1 Tax=unclassified Streptomyces TaxID=2593676 RepID=UPI003698C856
MEQPAGPEMMPLRTMWFALRAGVRWPEGPVRLHSRPNEHFDKRRVELGSCGRPYGTPCPHEHVPFSELA